MRLLEGPHLQTVDVEVLLGGEWLIVEGGAFGGGASVQLAVQPKTQMAAAVERGTESQEAVKMFFTVQPSNQQRGYVVAVHTLLLPSAESPCCLSQSRSSPPSSGKPEIMPCYFRNEEL